MDEPTSSPIRKHASAPPEVMIFGSGACARKIAANLIDRGIDAWLAARDEAPPETGNHRALNWLAGATLIRCSEFAGNFELQLQQPHRLIKKSVPAIVVAEDDRPSPNYAAYGLAPGSRVIEIAALEATLRQRMAETFFNGSNRIAFLCGWQEDSHPSVAKRMLDSCLQVQQCNGVKTFFMTGNLKVAADGAEVQVQEAKRSGTVFLKFTDAFPSVTPQADNRFVLDYLDELTGTRFRFEADWIVVDETHGPAPSLAALARKLRLDQDGAGFAQRDNVRRMSNATNRRGVFVAGGSRGILSAAEQLADADQVTLRVLTYLHAPDMESLPKATIQRGRCARCLTCYRLCPHMAIALGPSISVVTEACQSCGICLAGCPARAIEMEGVSLADHIRRQFKQPAATANTPLTIPQIMVFGCARSAGHAHGLTRMAGQPLPAGVRFVEVPCGGTIADRHLLAVFESGADGVMLFTCHSDNCQSEIGNRLARRRGAVVRDLLTAAGLDGDRLQIVSIAANMGTEFANRIEAFVREIDSLNGL